MQVGQQILRLGTRGSALALAQSGQVARMLMDQHPGLGVELVTIKTTADQIADRPLAELGGKGLFTRELEQALLAGEIDFAVHSLKDLPVTMPLVAQEQLIVAAVPAREDPRDVLVSRHAKSLDTLSPGAPVATGSLRRQCQLLSLRPDLQVIAVRGNIDTRLRKLADGQFDALILALAGLKRLGVFDPTSMQPINPETLLPAAGQGALALQCRRENGRVLKILKQLDDPISHQAVDAERELIRLLQGDCHSPIGVLVERQGEHWTMRATVGGRGGMPPIIHAAARSTSSGSIADQVYQELRRKGAQHMLAAG